MLRRLALTAAASAAALAAAPAAAHADMGPLHLSAPLTEPTSGDRLTVTVTGSGGAAGRHVRAGVRTRRAARTRTRRRRASGSTSGTWGTRPLRARAGRPALHDAVRRARHRAHHRDLERAGPSTRRSTGSNGCEIARWDRLVPVLPEVGRP